MPCAALLRFSRAGGSTMNFTDIIYEKSERVATVTLNRPERMNAWRSQLEHELRAAMGDAEADPAIGAIVVTGAGKAFCAGLDMGTLSKIATESGLSEELADARGGDDLHPNFRGRFAWLLAMKTP